MFPSHPLSVSTHVIPFSMANHQALLLNLHGRSFFKLITSNHAPLPKSSQNQITTTTTAKTQPKSNRNKNPEAHQIINQITPTEIKVQNPQNNQNHKMKTLKVNPLLKKHILVLLLYFRRRIILLN